MSRSDNRLTTRIASRLAHARRDQGGAAAIIFALALLVLAPMTLGLVDIYMVSTQKAQLQDALDAATLFAASSTATTSAQADAIGDKALTSNLVLPTGVTLVASTFTLTADKVTGYAEITAPGIAQAVWPHGNLKANSEVLRGRDQRVELVLVLDTTASMSGQKMTDMKAAATKLVTTMTADPQAKLKIGVVPFAQYVNTGVSRRNQTWMTVPADYVQNVAAGACTTQTTKTTCQSQAYSCTKYSDGIPYSSTCYRSVNCVTTPLNPPKTTCPQAYTINHVYSGCTGSPTYPKNVQDSDLTRKYPGYLDLTCASELLPLTNNFATVKTKISSLTAAGDTYIPAGLAWGFNLISNPVPFTEAEVYDASGRNLEPRKAIVLMTDGANSKLMNAGNGRHDGNPGNGQPATQANTYTAELCTNIKAQKIEVFTVAFQVPDAAAKTMLQTCASDAQHYFDATDSAALDASFAAIAQAMRAIYIAK